MQKKIFTYYFTIVMFVCSTLTTSAQTIIDYANWTPPTYCNIFKHLPSPPAPQPNTEIQVNNINHLTAIGTPAYVSGAVQLKSVVDGNNQVNGTEYRLTYYFKRNYTYKITVNAKKEDIGTPAGGAVNLRLNMTTNGTYANDDCNGPSLTYLNPSDGQKQLKQTFTSYTDIVFDYVSISQDAQYLMVAAILPGSSSNSQYVYIKKITITETAPPAPVFTLPASTNITCGSTSTKTFTVMTQSNPGNLTITDYTWNIGTTPNGWLLPNGNPAPQTISTGTTASINLTPACGTSHSNISATVTAGGNTYLTTGGAINVTAPSLSITGDGTICSGSATYSIDNLPCDASVTWSASPSGIVSLSCTSCNSTTITKTGSGSVTLTATITTSCSVQSPISKTIAVGAPDYQFQVYSSSSPDCYLTNEYYDFYVMPTTQQQQSIERYIWGYRDLSTNVATVVNYDGVSGEAILFPYEGMFEVFVQAENSCGDGQESVYNFVTAVESCPGFAFNASVAPNPSQNDAFITITDQSKDVKALPANTDVTMDLYQVNSTQKLKQWKFKNDRNKYQINVSGLHRGMYTLVITIGKYKRAKQLLVTE